jgi:hypothetical protein
MRILPALRSYQARVFRSLYGQLPASPGVQFTVMFPRQSGKNEVSAALVAALMQHYARREGSIIVCAPTLYPQARISLERTRSGIIRYARRWRIPLAAEDNVLRSGGVTATFLSASPEAHVAGHTASFALIAGEAQDIDPDWFDRQFRPMAASTGAPTVLFGTPWDGSTLLERAAEANRARDRDQPGEAYSGFDPWHHQVSWQEVAGVSELYGRYVAGERARLGASNPLFLSQYELVASRGAASLFDDEQLAALRGTHDTLSRARPGERYVGGLDFGGAGANADATVLTIARLEGHRCEVVAWRSWRSAPFQAIAAEVAAAASAWGLERLVADETGLGAPLVAQLQQILGRTVVGLVFTAASKSELGWALIGAAGSGRLALPAADGSADWRHAWDEVHACRRQLRPGGQVAWSAPPGRHDDYVASLALCLRAAETAGLPRLARGRTRD